jgi:hypothetical protein
MLCDQPVPHYLVVILVHHTLAVGTGRHDHWDREIGLRPIDVGPQDQLVVHRDRQVSFDHHHLGRITQGHELLPFRLIVADQALQQFMSAPFRFEGPAAAVNWRPDHRKSGGATAGRCVVWRTLPRVSLPACSSLHICPSSSSIGNGT